MIRDEFKNDSLKQTEKKIKQKKIEKGGEREYIAKRISKLNDMLAPIRFSTIFCTACFSILGIIYLAALIFVPDANIGWAGWLCISVFGVLLIWTVVWFAFLAPYIRKRIAYYRGELARLNAEYVNRYNKILNK